MTAPIDNRSLLCVAHAYEITLACAPEDDLRLNGPSREVGLDLPSRTVFVGPTARLEHVLHELAHIVTAPPGVSYETVPEDYILLQLERCWARELLNKKELFALKDWQETASAPLITPGEVLGEIPYYERSSPWRAGFHHLRILGLIDSSNRPTFRSPTWTKEELDAVRIARTVANANTCP
jgi:hypothetical protein